MGVLAANEMGAGRIIAMSRHKTRQDLALEFGATDIVSERGEAGVDRIKKLTGGIGADSVLECVGTQEAMTQAHRGGASGRDDRLCRRAAWRRVRWTKAVLLADAACWAAPPPFAVFCRTSWTSCSKRKIEPGKVFDLTLPLDHVAEGYRAMDERRAIKTLLRF